MHIFFSFAVKGDLLHQQWFATSQMIWCVISDIVHYLKFSAFPKCTNFSVLHQRWFATSSIICRTSGDLLHHHDLYYTKFWLAKILCIYTILCISKMHNFFNFAIKGDMLDQWWLTTLQAICCITSGDIVHYLKFSASPKCTNFSVLHQRWFATSSIICHTSGDLTSPWPIIHKILASQNFLHLHNSMHFQNAQTF